MVFKNSLFQFTLVGLTVFSSLGTSADTTLKSNYAIDSQVLCDGWPQVNVKTPEGLCVGIMASRDEGLKMPRYAVQSKEGVIYFTEMGGWNYGKGSVFALYTSTEKNGKKRTTVVDLFPTKKMTMPGGIIMDPEGRLYVGTPLALVRFNPRDSRTGKFNIDPDTEVVFNKFSKSIFRQEEFKSAKDYNITPNQNKNKHPLIQMAANADFSVLYVNIGAPSDNCGSGVKTIDDNGQCLQSESPLASASVWKITLSKDSKRNLLNAAPFSRGLRNSMALAVHPISGIVMQGENAMDLPDADLPFEELNILREGAHYGWPYCHSDGQVAPLFQDKVQSEDCKKKFAVPKVFMPAHTAPLGMLYYKGDLLPQFKNKLLVGWHGYQKNGHRVVAYPVNTKGEPTSNQYEEIVFGWDSLEGIRPRGAPTGLTELNDGSVLILDDKNGALLRLSKGTNAGEIKSVKEEQFSEESVKAFLPLVPFVKKNCSMCHAEFQKETAIEILSGMKGSMLNTSKATESSFYIKLKSKQMPPEMIRPSLEFDEEQFSEVMIQIDKFIRTL